MKSLNPAWLKNGPWMLELEMQYKFMLQITELANPMSTKCFLQSSSDMAMPFSHFGGTRPLPPVTLSHPFYSYWIFPQEYRTKDVNHWHFHYVLKGNRHVFHVDLGYCMCIANSCIWSEVWLGASPTNVSGVTWSVYHEIVARAKDSDLSQLWVQINHILHVQAIPTLL